MDRGARLNGTPAKDDSQQGDTDMDRWLKTLSVLAVGLLWTSMAQAQTADDIVEKHLSAIGGRASLGKLTTQAATGTLVISTQGVDLSGSVEVYRKSPNKARTLIRIDLSSVGGGGEMVIDQRCDGTSAFSSNSMQGDREITGSQLQGMLNASFPSPLLNYKAAGATIELLGKDKVGDRAVFVVQYTPKAGPASKNYFDAETYLLLRNVATIDMPELGGPVEQTSEFGDYRDAGGMTLPYRVTVINAAQTVSLSLAKVELNAAVDDAMFARPVK